MNERIKLLAYEAEDYADGIVDQGGEFHPAYTKKFAELVVRECAGIYSKIDNGNQHMGTEDYLEALQKHFRVEEK